MGRFSTIKSKSMRSFGCAVILAAASSCATAPPEISPAQLAQEQWQSCSNFPSVELINITSSGKILVREKHASTPPEEYLRCVTAVKYKQVLSEQLDARNIVETAYLTDTPPDRHSLTHGAPHLPVRAERFSTGEYAYFFYWLEHLDQRLEVIVEWHGPEGVYQRNTMHIGPTRLAYRGTWSTDSILLPLGREGQWHVQMFVGGFFAGQYEFLVS